MCFANYSKSSVRLNNDTKTREARELWNVREVVGPSMKSFGTENLPSLVCNFPSYSFLHSLVQEAIVICFIAAVSCINQTELQFFSFAAVTSLMPLSQVYIFFFSSTMKFRGIFARFPTTALYSLYR